MAATTNTSSWPRGLPETLGHAIGMTLFAGILSFFTIPVTVLPVLAGFVALPSGPVVPVAPALFGVWIASTFIGIQYHQQATYSQTETAASDILTTDPAAIRRLLVTALLLALYVNGLFVAAIALMQMNPQAAVALGILTPVVDRALLARFNYSPVFLLIVALAYIFEATQIVDDVNLEFIRKSWSTTPV